MCLGDSKHDMSERTGGTVFLMAFVRVEPSTVVTGKHWNPMFVQPGRSPLGSKYCKIWLYNVIYRHTHTILYYNFWFESRQETDGFPQSDVMYIYLGSTKSTPASSPNGHGTVQAVGLAIWCKLICGLLSCSRCQKPVEFHLLLRPYLILKISMGSLKSGFPSVLVPVDLHLRW